MAHENVFLPVVIVVGERLRSLSVSTWRHVGAKPLVMKEVRAPARRLLPSRSLRMTIKQIDKLILSAIKDLQEKKYEAAHVKLMRASVLLNDMKATLEVAHKIIDTAVE